MRFLVCYIFILMADTIFAGDLSWSGAFQFDQSFFQEEDIKEIPRGERFYQGAALRRAQIGFQKSFGEKLSLISDISLGKTNSLSLIFLDYKISENSYLQYGQIPSPWCLESGTSSKWLPFLESSLPVSAFKPCGGVGFGGGFANQSFTFQSSVYQPPYEMFSSPENARHDSLGASTHLVWRPLFNDTSIVHLGVSYHLQEIKDEVGFSSYPEIKSRYNPKIITTDGYIEANKYYVGGFEGAFMWQGFTLKSEFLQTTVKSADFSDLIFDGWYAQLVYNFDGKPLEYDLQKAVFGKPMGLKSGSLYQLAIRRSHLSLRDKSVLGSIADNQSVAINWYISEKIKMSANYVFSEIENISLIALDRTKKKETRELHAFSLRLQLLI